MKKLQKVLNVLLIALVLICASTNVFATKVNVDNIKDKGIDATAAGKLEGFGSTIISYISAAAMVVAVVMVVDVVQYPEASE